MKWLNWIERKMGRHYIPNLMRYIVFGMLGVFILEHLPLPRSAWELLYFNKTLILRGEIWRLITWIFLPPTGSILFILLNLYFYFFLGTSLENHWGSARFNIYYAIGILGNIVAGFLTGFTTNSYLNISLLLAFAVLYPDMEFTLFFFLPVKVRWIGWAWGLYLLYQLVTVPWIYKVSLALSMLPFVLYFGKDAWLQAKMDYRRLMRWINLRRQ
ncbi:MAG: rhomboid family intramembrane serine protease [Clostridia bacterium]|nr:rhomboid family intramembrane serine protease [Clostridia bacterium]